MLGLVVGRLQYPHGHMKELSVQIAVAGNGFPLASYTTTKGAKVWPMLIVPCTCDKPCGSCVWASWAALSWASCICGSFAALRKACCIVTYIVRKTMLTIAAAVANSTVERFTSLVYRKPPDDYKVTTERIGSNASKTQRRIQYIAR